METNVLYLFQLC